MCGEEESAITTLEETLSPGENNIVDSLLTHRVVLLNKPIDKDVIEEVYSRIRLLSFEDNEAPIELVINSDGGSVYETAFLCNFLLSGNHAPIITTGTANCQSGAFVLLVCGDYRRCYTGTLLMVHGAQLGHEEGSSTVAMQEYLDMLKEYEIFFIAILSSESLATPSQVEKRMRTTRDWYMIPSEALANGFIDEVIGPKHTTSDERSSRRKEIVKFMKENEADSLH